MFIEKISEDAKQAYIQKIVDRYNGNPNSNTLSLVKGTEWTAQFNKQRGYDEKIADLKDRNVHFGIYQNFTQDVWGRHSHEFAVITAFGDASVKTFKTAVGNDAYLSSNVANTLDFINQHQEQILAENPLATDQNYIKEFMLPNLAAIDEAQGTHLVADYKTALAEKFEKKKRLVIQNLEKRKADLGLEQ